MPGARPYGFRQGDRSELLAETVLNALAFTVRVPRQEDVGHDFLCALSEMKEQMVWAGPSFTVQVKSRREPLVFEEEHELAWIRGLDNPFFIAISDLKNRRVDIYSTWKRLLGILYRGCRRIILIPGNPNATYGDIDTKEDSSEQRIPLDRPILSVDLNDAMDEQRMRSLGEILRSWIILDSENIVRTRTGMYWVTGPTDYETNTPIDGRDATVQFFWNPNNLDGCIQNFGRSATALRTVIRAAFGEKETAVVCVSDLDQFLRSHPAILEPLAIQVLNEFVGLGLKLPDSNVHSVGDEPIAG
jgi:hypothetical protein